MVPKAGTPVASRVISGLAALVLLIGVLVPSRARPAAAASAVLDVTTQPALFPAFDPAITDYVVRCDPSKSIDVSVDAPGGVTVAVNGKSAASGAFSTGVRIQEGQSFSFVVTQASSSPMAYFVRCLPSDFPTWTTTRPGTPQAEWYLLVPIVFAPGDRRYAVFFDAHGVPVWWRPTGGAVNSRILEDGDIATVGESVLETGFDGSLIRTTRPVGGSLDGHDVRQLANGNRLIISNLERPGIDFSSWPGVTGSSVLDQQIQEVAPDGSLVWSWDTNDHIPVSETGSEWRQDFVGSPGPYDAYHMNSLEIDGDALIVSFRHLDAVYRIDRSTGAILWKMGGSTRPESLTVVGDPVFSAGGTLGGQHDARVLPDGTLTIHDNGSRTPRSPRAVRYAINPTAKTATLIEQVTDSVASSSICCGSARKLPPGDWVVSWGSTPNVAELSATDTPVFRLTLAPGHTSYRAEPVLPGVLDRADLRAGMDAQYPFTVDVAASSVASPGFVAADGSTGSVRVLLRDAYGNPVTGKQVTLKAQAGRSTIAPTEATTDAAGVATFAVHDTDLEDVVYETDDTTDSLSIGQAAVSFVTGPMSSTSSSVSVAPVSLPADGSSKADVTVVLRDAAAHPIEGKSVSLDQGGGRSSITPALAVTDSQGKALFDVTSVRAGTVRLVASDTTDSTLVQQGVAVSFTQPPNAPYWLLGGGGRVFAFGGAPAYGSIDDQKLNGRVVAMASTPHAGGYWLTAADGGVFAFGDAPFLGSMGGTRLNSAIVGMAATPDGSGYWLVGADGGIFAFGGARFFGSTGGTPLGSSIASMAVTPDGGGYWLVAADGEVYPFGDAKDLGSLGGWPLASPVVGMAAAPDGLGYSLVAADGGVFSFGTAGFFGSLGGVRLNSPISALILSGDAGGYTLVARDGGAFSFGDAPFFGSLGGNPLTAPIVGGARAPA